MEITVKKLEAVLGGSRILNSIDLEVPSNRMVGIIGPNGSGKSTLLRCIYRVLKPTKGAVFLDGRPLQEHSIRQSAQKIAVVAQHNYYNFDFTVEDVVLMGRSPHKRSMERDNAQDYLLWRKALPKWACPTLKSEVSPPFPEGNSNG